MQLKMGNCCLPLSSDKDELGSAYYARPRKNSSVSLTESVRVIDNLDSAAKNLAEMETKVCNSL